MPNHAVPAAAEGLPKSRFPQFTQIADSLGLRFSGSRTGRARKPDCIVNLKDSFMNQHVSRRTIVTATAASIACGTALGSAIPAAALPAGHATAELASHPDAELIRLGKELDRLRPINAELGTELWVLQKGWIAELDRRGVKVQSDVDSGCPIYNELGGAEVEDRHDRVADLCVELTKAILAAVPTTIAGLAVKAKCYRFECSGVRAASEPTEAEYDEMDWDDEITLRLVFDIERMAADAG